MYGYIKGEIVWNDKQTVTIMSGAGLGLRIFTNQVTQQQLLKKNPAAVELFLHTRVTQDNIAIFGFAKKEQIAFFETILAINGVGPKLGMEMLVLPLSQLTKAIAEEDVAFLKSIKGLGKKTAERLILELKGKLPHLESSDDSTSQNGASNDVILALENFGYKRRHIMQVFSNLSCDNLSESEMIKHFLQNV